MPTAGHSAAARCRPKVNAVAALPGVTVGATPGSGEPVLSLTHLLLADNLALLIANDGAGKAEAINFAVNAATQEAATPATRPLNGEASAWSDCMARMAAKRPQ